MPSADETVDVRAETARFDDLTPGSEQSFRLAGLRGEVAAFRPEDVRPALHAVEEASAEGLWAAGFVAYEAAPGLDPNLKVRRSPPDDPFAGLPLIWFAFFDEREELQSLEPSDRRSPIVSRWEPTTSRAAYDAAIDDIHENIAAGDTYQVNFTIRLRGSFDGDELGLYRQLCTNQRAAYSGYLNAGRYSVLSASPELFFRIDGRRILLRPMKGTVPRGRWVEEDHERVDWLRASIKDRAENAMIVDLLRNDVGRISDTGSVRWPRVFTAERYETVWQLTSTIVSRLRDDVELTDVFAALFPSGSVTGAPKVRTMEITRELERSPRGVYTGAVGWVAPARAPGPRAMFNVAIRTVVLDRATGTAEYGVGGGITWDSVAKAEYDECVAKARVLSVHRPSFDLLETLRWEPGEGYLWLDRHLDRMAASAEYFGFCVDLDLVRRYLDKSAEEHAGEGPAKVRLVVSRRCEISIDRGPLPEAEQGRVRVVLDDEPTDPGDSLRFHKTTHRALYERRIQRHPEADDVILVNTRGEITESTIANVVVRLDGRWWTPPLDTGCLPGVYRAVLLDEGKLAERTIGVGELPACEDLGLINSVRLWRPAVVMGATTPSREFDRSLDGR
jgi:para-aminobenzoate synthetase / 4-amino-4-deoxychorismate lyase